MTEPHDRPTVVELLSAVQDYLEQEVIEATSGRVQFHARVAGRVLAMVGRELESDAELRAAHRDRLERLGVTGNEELVERIRSGDYDDDLVDAGVVRSEIADVLWATVLDKVRVANPGYLDVADRDED